MRRGFSHLGVSAYGQSVPRLRRILDRRVHRVRAVIVIIASDIPGSDQNQARGVRVGRREQLDLIAGPDNVGPHYKRVD